MEILCIGNLVLGFRVTLDDISYLDSFSLLDSTYRPFDMCSSGADSLVIEVSLWPPIEERTGFLD